MYWYHFIPQRHNIFFFHVFSLTTYHQHAEDILLHGTTFLKQRQSTFFCLVGSSLNHKDPSGPFSCPGGGSRSVPSGIRLPRRQQGEFQDVSLFEQRIHWAATVHAVPGSAPPLPRPWSASRSACRIVKMRRPESWSRRGRQRRIH